MPATPGRAEDRFSFSLELYSAGAGSTYMHTRIVLWLIIFWYIVGARNEERGFRCYGIQHFLDGGARDGAGWLL